jgi:GrpB-like predicted nucleotidyltransferase (UPF0157 family)
MSEPAETDQERRARLYPIILSEYNPAWPEWFAEEKASLERLIDADSIFRISHFGSTAVPGLTAKPTVDILLEINKTADIENVIAALSPPDYIYLKQESAPTISTPQLHLMFLKGYLPDGFAKKVYHIHVVYPGAWDERLCFRDYLTAHPETAAEYAALKRSLHKDYENNRDGYMEAKGEFVRAITKIAMEEAL